MTGWRGGEEEQAFRGRQKWRGEEKWKRRNGGKEGVGREWGAGGCWNECNNRRSWNGKRCSKWRRRGKTRRWKRNGGSARRTRRKAGGPKTKGGRGAEAGAEDAGRDKGLWNPRPPTPPGHHPQYTLPTCSPPSAPLLSLLAPAGLTRARRCCHGNS